MFCLKCGNKLPDVANTRFCGACGAAATVLAAVPETKTDARGPQNEQSAHLQQPQEHLGQPVNRQVLQPQDYMPPPLQTKKDSISQAKDINTKFPAVAICIALSILLSATLHCIRIEFSSIYRYRAGQTTFGHTLASFHISFLGSLLINVFALIALLISKRGRLLTAAACSLAIWPIITTVWNLLLEHHRMLYQVDATAIFFRLLYHLPLLLIFWLAAYCYKNKVSPKKKNAHKLWFIPGIASSALFALSLTPLPMLTRRLPLSYVLLSTILTGLLGVATVFLLGYRIYQTYSTIRLDQE